ncbi:MAG TPA: NUDIX domain-containing protein [Pyrinomonadaceae bacterium]|jgi:8-oxo-dGTP diphosphatase
MSEPLIFGVPAPHVAYTLRRAAYVVIVETGRVALVAGARGFFLPGGGAWAGERPEATVGREVREELARGMRRLRRLGAAVQYFYAERDATHYEMHAVFFTGALTARRAGNAEHELLWLPPAEAARVCYHECHAWAVRRACAG